MISTSINPSNSGTITGAGTYMSGENVNLIATANNGYNFVNWTVNNMVVSSNTNYNFTVSENKILIANFKQVTNIDAFDNSDKISLYPNPATDYINIELPNTVKSIEIIDINGKAVSTTQVEKNSSNIKIPIKNFKAGTYFLIITAENFIYRKKIIISK